ncbi:MAG TPA: hypothetical protein VGC41_11335 [Kofleriaceae bacterium]
MITIELQNIDEIVEKQKGWFVANVVGAVVDLQPKVEDVVIEKLKESFAEQGIRATITRS